MPLNSYTLHILYNIEYKTKNETFQVNNIEILKEIDDFVRNIE